MRKFFLFLLASTLITSTASARDYSEAQSNSAVQSNALRINNSNVKIIYPKVLFSNMNSQIEIQLDKNALTKLEQNDYKLMFVINDQNTLVTFNAFGLGKFEHKFMSNEQIQLSFEDFNFVDAPQVPSIAWMLAPISLILFMIGYRVLRNNNSTITKENDSPSEPIYSSEEKKSINIRTVKEMTEEVFS